MDTSKEYHIEMFTGRTNFSLWKQRMKDVLISKGLKKALTGKKPERMSDRDWEELEKAPSAIRLTLDKDVLFNIMEIESASELWGKLESI